MQQTRNTVAPPSYKHDAIFCFLAVLPTFAALVPVVGAAAALRELGDGGLLRAGFLASSIAGLAIGYLFIGNVADRYGQRLALKCSLLAFAALSGVLYVVTDPALFLVLRFFQALSSSGCMVIPQALYKDAYTGVLARRANAISVLGTALGPISAFLLGAALDVFWSWRVGFLITALLAAAAYFWAGSLPFAGVGRPAAPQTSARPGGFAVFALIPAFCFAGSYAFFVTAPIMGSSEMGIPTTRLSLLLCLPPIGLALGSTLTAALSSRHGTGLLAAGLVLQVAAALAVSVLSHNASLFAFFAMFFYGLANGLTVSLSTARAIARYAGPSGAAAAAAGFIRMAGAALGACTLALTNHVSSSAAISAALLGVAILLLGALACNYRQIAAIER